MFIEKTQKEKKMLLAQFMGLEVFDKLWTTASEEIKDVAAVLKSFKENDWERELSDIKKDKEELDKKHKKLIEANQQDLYYFSIIYELIDHVKQQLSGLLDPDIKEEIIGIAEVKDVYRSSKIGAIAGSMVSEGIIQKDQPIRVLRDNVVIFEGELESLRRFKDDVKEVQSGTECGIGVKDYNDVKPGDQIEVFKRTEIKRTIQ